MSVCHALSVAHPPLSLHCPLDYKAAMTGVKWPKDAAPGRSPPQSPPHRPLFGAARRSRQLACDASLGGWRPFQWCRRVCRAAARCVEPDPQKNDPRSQVSTGELPTHRVARLCAGPRPSCKGSMPFFKTKRAMAMMGKTNACKKPKLEPDEPPLQSMKRCRFIDCGEAGRVRLAAAARGRDQVHAAARPDGRRLVSVGRRLLGGAKACVTAGVS